METPAAETEEEALTEEDCRELWRIIQGLEREYKEMNSIADDWFAVHGKKTGCLAALVAMTLLPWVPCTACTICCNRLEGWWTGGLAASC